MTKNAAKPMKRQTGDHPVKALRGILPKPNMGLPIRKGL